MLIFNFCAFLESFCFFTDLRYWSRPPLKSTERTAALVTFNVTFFLSLSLIKVTFFKFGKNLLLVLLLAWLTLLPFKGDTPVSSHLFDINNFVSVV